MTVEEAEDTYMAWQVGLEFDQSKIAEALLILKNKNKDD